MIVMWARLGELGEKRDQDPIYSPKIFSAAVSPMK
jgi:hypothetical protein